MHTIEQTGRIHTVVVVGGGYAGLLAANRVHGITRGAVRVILVSDQTDFVHRICLHELAAGGAFVRRPLSAMLRVGIERVHGRVARIDAAEGRCVIDPCGGGDARSLAYDALVYAVGSSVDTSTPGVAEYAYALTDEEGAARLARRLRELAPGARVVVVGGGLCGVEMAAEIAESHPALAVSLVCDALAQGIGTHARDAVAQGLHALRVEVIEGVRVARLESDAVVLGDGARVEAAAVVWTAGFVVPELARRSGLAVDARGRLKLDATLRAVGAPAIFGCGDAAAAPAECLGGGAGPTVMSATTAMPMAAHVADTIADLLEARAARRFRFDYLAWCVSLGRERAVMYFVDADNRPTGRVLTGGFAALQKRFLSNYGPFWLWMERRLPGSYVWPGCLSRSSGAPPDRAVSALLAFAAALYAALAVACVVAPGVTSQRLGLVALGTSGVSEYFAVFGGVPAALAATFFDALVRPRRRPAALRLLAWVNVGFVASRLLAVAREGADGMGAAWVALALECALLVAAVSLAGRTRFIPARPA